MATTKITTNSLADASVTSAKLASSISIGTLTVTGNETVAGNQTITGNLTVDTNTFFVDSVNNRVGVGTISPLGKFDVSTSSGVGIYFTETSTNPTFQAYGSSKHIYFKPTSQYTVFQSSSNTTTMQIQGGAGGYQSIRFFGEVGDNRITTNLGDLTITPFSNTIFSSGNVGIGAAVPSAKLDVNGTFNVSGNATIPDIIGDTSFTDDVEVLGALTVAGQPALSALGGNHVMTKNLNISQYTIGQACSYFGVAQAGGSQTTSQYIGFNGALSFGPTPISGDAGIRAIFQYPMIIGSGNSYASNSSGNGSMLDWTVNHALCWKIGTPSLGTARDVAVRMVLGGAIGTGTGTGKLGPQLSTSGYGWLITKHPSDNTYILRLTLRTNNFATSILAATNASPIVITQNSHRLNNGDYVEVAGVSGNTAANGVWVVANATTNTLELSGSVGNGAYTASTGALTKITSDFVTLNPYTFYEIYTRWDAANRTVSLHLGDVNSTALLTLSGGGISTNTFFSQTGPLSLGFYSVTDTSAYLVVPYAAPIMYKL